MKRSLTNTLAGFFLKTINEAGLGVNPQASPNQFRIVLG
jgi:hypothetical protein